MCVCESDRDHDKLRVTEANVDDILYKKSKNFIFYRCFKVQFIRANHLGMPWNEEKYN